MSTHPTAAEITDARTERGGWTRAQLAEWGVPWPPPRGWRKRLVASASMAGQAETDPPATKESGAMDGM